ncbi:Rne/Rng family ribonuclease [Actinomycetospora straminea]|uniref:S1 motif domain-containing protein n=1 Tax=Actinomycetospora straminea TaxID=663607 RepID=A0ABP9ENG2_9PSEU|nr:Rne/Rng family ribonuclease [Actinomycetospora straminea]MDD7935509.1 Rne/Rng family ribonuclease [Actinomycetospora straminea]
MTDIDTPSGGDSAAGGSVAPGRPDDAALAALPDKVRVHALARVVGTSSRELLAVLARLGVGARSAQSSVDRGVVAQVVEDLFPAEGAVAAPVAQATPGAAAVLDDLPEPADSVPALDTTPDTTDDTTDDTTPDTGAGVGDGATTLPGQAPASAPSAAAPAFAAPMFLAPESTSTPEAAPSRTRRRRGSRSTGVVTPGEATETETTGEPAPTEDEQPAPAEASAPADTTAAPETGPETGEPGDGDDDEDGGRRRRRRGRRGRGRGRGGSDDADGSDGSDTEGDDQGESDDASGAGDASGSSGSSDDGSDDGDDSGDDEDTAEGSEGESSGGSRRRRRRRRRSSDDGSSDSASGGSSDGSTDRDDPPDTVTHVRDRVERPEGGRSSNDEVRGVKGSTRLEAKRQRRRDGRESGRRRPAILSESEFLARREAVERTMVVRQQAGRSQIGVLEDGVLVEHFVAGEGQNSMVGNVYLGRVQNVLPSMEAAFVDIGRGRNAVLYAGEVNWDASGLEGKQRKIEQALSTGDQVLVQVTKDPVGHKGARLTTQISLPGRFLVYVPAGGATGISRKLPDTERKRLKEILKRIVPDESGVIIRTAAEGVSEEDLERDVRRLTAQWEAIESSAAGAKSSKGPTLVYEEPDLLIRVVRDMFNEDFSSLVVSGERAWETLEGYVAHVAPELAGRLTRHVGPQDVFAAYRIDEQLIKALDRKVWLPSGGTLVIDRTEAMTVVDVNTGKFTGSGGNLEETVTRNNLEAAEEIVRQLRLRDIGGMIVIDFIDMVLESNRDLVLRRLTECLGRDRTRHQVSEVTSLGLVQMTRKRVGQGLLDEFSTTCEHCRGRGVIVSTEPVIGHEHGASASNGSGGSTGSNGSGKGGEGKSEGKGEGKSGGEGGSSGRRSRRGRRAERSEGASPATVAAATGLLSGDDEDEPETTEPAAVATAAEATAEAPAEAGPGDSGTVGNGDAAAETVVEADEAEVELEAGLATASAAGSAAEAEETDATGDAEPVEQTIHEAVQAEVALEADLAEHTPGANGTTPTEPEPERPRITGAIGGGANGGLSRGRDEGLVTPAGPATEEPADEPATVPAAVPTGSGSARPRRRRAASRPAGPPAGGSDS